MKIILKLIFITVSFIWAACNKEVKKIEYGSGDGKLVTIRNTKIYYEEYGQGVPLILLSGGGLERSIKDFEKCIPELSKHFKVTAPDTPGQGRSEQPDSVSYQVFAEFMSQFIDSLKVDSVYVMGWSDGGIIGILLAEKRPDKVKKVIAVGPNNGLAGAAPPGTDLSLFSPTPLDEYEKNNKHLIEEYMSKLPRDWRKMANGLNNMWYATEYFPTTVYDRIKIPVMIVLGDRDAITIEHGLAMHRSIKGSQFCILPNTPHEVFTKRPELINKIAVDFF